MKCLNNNNLKNLRVAFLAILLLAPTLVSAEQGIVRKDTPSGGAMLADAVIARPMLFAATAAGTGLFFAGLPFSALGGNIKETGSSLVMAPARSALVRCLGCTPIQSEKNKTRRKQEIAKGKAYK